MKRLSLAQQMCEWERVDEWRAQVRSVIARGEEGKLAPFLALSIPGITANEQRRCAELWMKQRIDASALQRSASPFTFATQAKPKIRVGYLSCDFHESGISIRQLETEPKHANASLRHGASQSSRRRVWSAKNGLVGLGSGVLARAGSALRYADGVSSAEWAATSMAFTPLAGARRDAPGGSSEA